MWSRAAPAIIVALLSASCERGERVAPQPSTPATPISADAPAVPTVDCRGLIVFEPGIDLAVSDYLSLSPPQRSSPLRLQDGSTATVTLRVFDMEDERPANGEAAAVGVVVAQSDRQGAPALGGTLWAKPDEAHFDSFEVPAKMSAGATAVTLEVRPNYGDAGPCRSGLVLRLEASGALTADGVKVAALGD